jgi:hypothetical protein
MARTERLLLAFGPLGVSVYRGTYDAFKAPKTDVIRVELSDRCVRGRRRQNLGLFSLMKPKKSLDFEIPYESVLAARLLPHPAQPGVQEILEITYRDDAGAQAVLSIVMYVSQIQQAHSVLGRYAPTEPMRPW